MLFIFSLLASKYLCYIVFFTYPGFRHGIEQSADGAVWMEFGLLYQAFSKGELWVLKLLNIAISLGPFWNGGIFFFLFLRFAMKLL